MQSLTRQELLTKVRDAWNIVETADGRLVVAIGEAQRGGGITYRNIADSIIKATGEPAATNEARRKFANRLKERVGRASRATKR